MKDGSIFYGGGAGGMKLEISTNMKERGEGISLVKMVLRGGGGKSGRKLVEEG